MFMIHTCQLEYQISALQKEQNWLLEETKKVVMMPCIHIQCVYHVVYLRLNYIHNNMVTLPWIIKLVILCLYILQLTETNTMLETVNVALKANLAKKDSEIATLQSSLKEESDKVRNLKQKLTMVKKVYL